MNQIRNPKMRLAIELTWPTLLVFPEDVDVGAIVNAFAGSRLLVKDKFKSGVDVTPWVYHERTHEVELKLLPEELLREPLGPDEEAMKAVVMLANQKARLEKEALAIIEEKPSSGEVQRDQEDVSDVPF